MKKINLLLGAILASASTITNAAYNANTTDVSVTRIKMSNNNSIYFWVNAMPTGCTGTYFEISTGVADAIRNRYLTLLTTARNTGKKVIVGYDSTLCNQPNVLMEALEIK